MEPIKVSDPSQVVKIALFCIFFFVVVFFCIRFLEQINEGIAILRDTNVLLEQLVKTR